MFWNKYRIVNNLQHILQDLTAPKQEKNYQELSNTFMQSTGWSPSYFINADDEDFANGHIAVEHGLENTAILTFLNKPYDLLTTSQKQKLFNLSYNNLVDWHIPIDETRITYVYTRTDLKNSVVDSLRIGIDNYDNLRIEAFEKIIGKKPTANTPALDIVLSETISIWKRRISLDLNMMVSNDELSALFNCIIFIRAIEDNLKRHKKLEADPILLKAYNAVEIKNISNIITNTIQLLGINDIPEDLLNMEKLTVFNSYNVHDLNTLLKSFYTNNVNGFFYYDFSIISQHALSRIYEKYVALLKTKDEIQLNMWGVNAPEEKINKSSGTYYTPQYIARFFAKLIAKEFPIISPNIKILEPSVGSGIFLRSLLELQIDNLKRIPTVTELSTLFANVTGFDIDPNAVLATKLSLSLLYLIFTDSFPNHLNVVAADSIEELSKSVYKVKYDVVVSNPPFIRVENRNEEIKERFLKHLGTNAFGKGDEYLLFLDKTIKVLKPGGFGLFVLPHSFLINNSAKKIREIICEKCIIKYLVDLTAIPVFENTGVYVILLIFQKKGGAIDNGNATILKCRSSVGKALQDVINKNNTDEKAYSIYNISQNYFKNDYWFVLGKNEIAIKNKLDSFSPINSFLEIRQGFVSGSDEVFVVNTPPKGEKNIYKFYLPDKEIYQYGFDKRKLRYIFYPYLNDKKITEEDLKNLYPNTWSYLVKHKSKLSNRSLLGSKKWWEPSNPRLPEHILNPKIVTPHLVFVPKFSLDMTGNITTSHSPYLYLKRIEDKELDQELLYYFLGILNSTPCFWYISSHSHKYGGSYNRLEVATLKNTPVPNPASLNQTKLVRFIKLIKQRVFESTSENKYKLENEIDMLACQFYGFSESEIEFFHGNFEI